MTAARIICTCAGCAGQGTFYDTDDALRQVSIVCTATAGTRHAGQVQTIRSRHRKLG